MTIAIIVVGTPPGLRPSGEVDFRIYQGDTWVQTFTAFSDQPLTPFDLTGYSATFSVRRGYADASPMYSMTTSTPSVNGSTVGIVTSTLTTTTKPADSSLATPLPGQRTTRVFHNLFVTSPAGVVTTIAAGSIYIWTRT